MTRKEIEKLAKKVAKTPARSAWKKGVRHCAEDLLQTVADIRSDKELKAVKNYGDLEKLALNGSKDWKQYTRNGTGMIWNEEIAETFCTPSELKRTKGGQLPPNGREDWMDVYARGMYQASWLIERCYNLLF